MIIRPSAAIRQKYNEISSLCRKGGEPLFLTKDGEDDLVVMDIEYCNRMKKMLRLRAKLSASGADRMDGREGCTLDELESALDAVIDKA